MSTQRRLVAPPKSQGVAFGFLGAVTRRRFSLDVDPLTLQVCR